MIVKMEHLDLVALAHEREAALSALRELGVVHLDLSGASGKEVLDAKGVAADAAKAVRAIEKARAGLENATSSQELRRCTVQEVLALESRKDSLSSNIDELEKEIRKYEPYGDFDPILAGKLLAELGDDLRKVADLPERLPAESLGAMRTRLVKLRSELEDVLNSLAGCDDKALAAGFGALEDAIRFSAAKETMVAQGEVAFISGWVPEKCVGALRKAAAGNGWAVLVRDRLPGEIPPTLIEPPKLFRPVKALFDGLGIAPAYDEADVSVPFMCYFSLFFAMLVGDGAYGLIFLFGTLAMKKKLPKSWFVLLTVFSLATVGWGLLSNTWFGAAIPACADWPTVKWLGDATYKNMMLLCFTIGASHLTLARLWNAACKAPDSTALAELGWAGVIVMMYLVTNSIVGIFPGVPKWGMAMGIVSILLVFLFSVKPSELKTRGAELGMLPLNIMSALGDIISYVRLFAVGLASVKVAENFNQMATGLDLPLWLKVVPMVAILIVGHALNLAMAGLSILVHAVRLNTLEFSNHKGVSWSGYGFRPFRKASAGAWEG